MKNMKMEYFFEKENPFQFTRDGIICDGWLAHELVVLALSLARKALSNRRNMLPFFNFNWIRCTSFIPHHSLAAAAAAAVASIVYSVYRFLIESPLYQFRHKFQAAKAILSSINNKVWNNWSWLAAMVNTYRVEFLSRSIQCYHQHLINSVLAFFSVYLNNAYRIASFVREKISTAW